MSGIGKIPVQAAQPLGQPPPPDFPQGDRIWKFRGASPTSLSPGRRARPPSSLLPPFRGEVGRGVPPLGAPASRRPRAKRERGCGPSARHAGETPTLPGSPRMSGIGKVPVRAAAPLDQPPSRPPPFQGGGEKTQGGGGEKTARPASLSGSRRGEVIPRNLFRGDARRAGPGGLAGAETPTPPGPWPTAPGRRPEIVPRTMVRFTRRARTCIVRGGGDKERDMDERSPRADRRIGAPASAGVLASPVFSTACAILPRIEARFSG